MKLSELIDRLERFDSEAPVLTDADEPVGYMFSRAGTDISITFDTALAFETTLNVQDILDALTSMSNGDVDAFRIVSSKSKQPDFDVSGTKKLCKITKK